MSSKRMPIASLKDKDIRKGIVDFLDESKEAQEEFNIQFSFLTIQSYYHPEEGYPMILFQWGTKER